MSRRYRARREAVEAKRISELPEAEISGAHDDDDSDFAMLGTYRSCESTDPMEEPQCQH